jgi:hypothetical protein
MKRSLGIAFRLSEELNTKIAFGSSPFYLPTGPKKTPQELVFNIDGTRRLL